MNSKSRSESYAAAGVDITAGYKAVELMKTHIARTLTSGVCSDVGGFGGLFELDLRVFPGRYSSPARTEWAQSSNWPF